MAVSPRNVTESRGGAGSHGRAGCRHLGNVAAGHDLLI